MKKMDSDILKDNIRTFLPKFFYSIYDLMRVLPHLNCMKRYQVIEHNNTLRILGSGNSLKSILKETFSDSDCMVVNTFVNSDYFEKVKPLYYLITDRMFWLSQAGMDVFDKINQSVQWKMYLLIPDTRLCKSIKRTITNPNVELLFFSPREYRGFNVIKYYLYKKKLANPAICNVLIPSIMTGIHLNYSNIELYGVEHSWTKYLVVGDDNVLYSNYPHFYEDGSDKLEKVVDSYGREVLLHHFLLTYSRVFATYYDISDFIERYGIPVEIVNRSKGSYIQAFARK